MIHEFEKFLIGEKNDLVVRKFSREGISEVEQGRLQTVLSELDELNFIRSRIDIDRIERLVVAQETFAGHIEDALQYLSNTN